MNVLSKLWESRFILRSIFYSIYFNFSYLPFNQAYKLPILLYKPKLKRMRGVVEINADSISFGMIRLGFQSVSLYPNSGFVYENAGGKCVFSDKCNIGSASSISIGEKGNVFFGNKFSASAGLKLTSYHYIEFKEKVRIGWDCLITDTDFHKITKVGGGYKKGYAPIVIGNNNWIGLRCTILKNTQTPDFCIVGSNSVLNKNYNVPSFSLISGNPATLKSEGVWRNLDDDVLEYEHIGN